MNNLIKWVSLSAGIITLISAIAYMYKKFFTKKEQNKKILFIDDEVNEFPIIETLRSNNYEIDTMLDVENLSDEKIKKSKIIFVDYKGVGKKFGKKQGIDLIDALKKTYPKKIIILFSAHKGFGIGEHLQIADDMIDKNASLKKFMDMIDKY